ncbi:hypothetical protein BGX26_007944 [Mortierella sp. AD094]|nr:hypothetical protein BGX26_007944 [Mortierella sp. AD094]
MSGNLSATSQEIELIEGHILRAVCRTADGDWVESVINLDDHIGNRDGHFQWDGERFSETAVAMLRREDGEFKQSSIFLDDKTTDSDGRLEFV